MHGMEKNSFQDEIIQSRKINKAGLICMAHDSRKENANRSQFFITLRGEDMDYLEGRHTVFGEVAEGLDIILNMNNLYIDEEGRPYQDVRIKHTHLLDDPFPDPSELNSLIPSQSPERFITIYI
jgi:peptidyl-prolyl cis-trans isomerase-like 4